MTVVEVTRIVDDHDDSVKPDRDAIDGSRVIARQTAHIIHPPTGKMVQYLDLDEVLLDDGRTMWQCNSRYGNCTMYSERSFALVGHVKTHVPTEMRKDRAKYLPDPDKAVRTPLPDEPTAATRVGDAAAVVLAFSDAGAQALEQAQRDEDVTRLREIRVKTRRNSNDKLTPEERSERSRRAYETRRQNGNLASFTEPRQNGAEAAGMKMTGVEARIEMLIEDLHDIEAKSIVVQNALNEVLDTVKNLPLADPEIVRKAERFDQLRGLMTD